MSAKIVLLAAGDIGLATGIAINESEHQLLAVVSPPPKPSGRGRSLCLCPTNEWGENSKISCLTTKSIRKDDEVKNKIKSLAPDLIVIADFGQIVPQEIIDLPKIACINVHPSLLPKYRGAAPINWPIINGDKTTGTTIMYITEQLDAGDIILQKEVEINPDDTSISLECRLAKESGNLLIKAIDVLLKGTALRLKQDESKVCWAPKLEKETGIIDWSLTADNIVNRIRGLKPWPGTFTFRNGKILHIKKAIVTDASGMIGEVKVEKDSLIIVCGKNGIQILEIQPEGKNTMDSKSFINGYRPENGEVWGNK